MKSRPRYITVAEAQPGMVLGGQLNVMVGDYLLVSLPSGHTLSPDDLQQLIIHRVEFIFINEPDTRSDQQVAVDAASAAHRTMQIFSDADLSDPTVATIFNQVIVYRSA